MPDVTISITVPDVYVSRVSAAILARHPACVEKGWNAKQCLIAEIKWMIKQEVLAYEREQAAAAAQDAVTEIDVTGA